MVDTTQNEQPQPNEGATTSCYDCETNQCACATRNYRLAVSLGRGLERKAIVKWLRTYPQTCDCGYKDCHFTNTMTVDELADAVEQGAHNE